jgi:hypothetical protein
MGERPPPRLAGVGIRRLSTRWLRFCHFRFDPGPPGEEGGSLEFVKTRKTFRVGRPAVFPRPEDGFRMAAPAAFRSPRNPGGLPYQSLR